MGMALSLCPGSVLDTGGFSTVEKSGRNVNPKSGRNVKLITPLFTAELHFIRIKWGGKPSG